MCLKFTRFVPPRHIEFKANSVMQNRVAQEPETGTVRTVFPGTDGGTRAVGIVLQEPKLEPRPSVRTVMRGNGGNTVSRALFRRRELTEPH